MKKLLLVCLTLALLGPPSYAQENSVLAVESYRLTNGLTVFLNQDSTANRVFGAVMVNAGAKHEDPSATGMAHYLEHLLFKGTEHFGTSDFEKEKPHLDSINVLYERLAQAQADDERESIQLLINEQALAASAYGLPNEFDKMLKSIGGTGINAFTNMEMTFYHNSFPGHEINKWLDLYAARFQNPIFRSFQSELEVVYEEKNRAMDNFQRKIGEEMQRQIFPNIPYGQWTVLGKIEHLKNPSLIRMYQFFEENYKAGNMALILSGNFDPAFVKPIIEEKFNKLPAGTVEKLVLDQPTPFKGTEVAKKRMTPVKASFEGYHTVGNNHPDRLALDVVEYLLFNGAETGYLNQLMTSNQITYSGVIPMTFNDAGGLVVFYVPKIVGQSLGKAERLVEAQLDKLREGEFSDEMLAAAKNELAQSFSSNLENVTERGIMIGRAFNQGKSWEDFIAYPQKLDLVRREDVLRVAKQYLGKDRIRVISRTGFAKGTKLEKPNYKPIVTEQKEQSDYYAEFEAIPALPFQPRFLDFEHDVAQIKMQGGHQLLVANNPINDLFELEIKF
ncbi:MAG: pitrilysin family protein, partial [Bacteroidota bacterium]